jgi:two-component system, NtrC family, nitrogen regulation sensor histidine kinase NtrY
MRRRLLYASAIVLLVISVVLVAWQGSFRLRQPGLASAQTTLIFWAISILIFVLMVGLGWVLSRTAIKLYVERRNNVEGSRIRTKLALGGLALSIIPVICLVLFGYEILNVNMKAWFTQPAADQLAILDEISDQLKNEMRDEVAAQSALLAAQPDTAQLIETGLAAPDFLSGFARRYDLTTCAIYRAGARTPVESWSANIAGTSDFINGSAPVRVNGREIGSVTVTAQVPLDLAKTTAVMDRMKSEQSELYENRKTIRFNYTMLMALITLFVLSVATWIALFVAKQISVPIAALLEAAGEVRRGNLGHRVDVKAGDEIGTLVRSFNQMTEELDASSRELDRRRRFTEAILESIPTGVLSVDADGSVRRVNRALANIFPAEDAARATRLEDLFSRDDTAEIKFLMKRARRTGVASRQIELRTGNRKLQLGVTVSALEEKLTSGFVIVLEDATELLRAQKAEAWHEVARRVAHEIKNPLTPIALSAERIERQVEKMQLPAGQSRIISECAATIIGAVESVKTLVDEFSQYARFPSAQLAPADLNAAVKDALAVFLGRLDGIVTRTDFAGNLPPVSLDIEQFRRVVVNLVDNAAEAMQDSLVKEMRISTRHGSPETVELVVADSGCGVGAEDKEKLFLPYFSTKNRGTGLGLAIVSHIVTEHGGNIRVEDNQPVGSRFIVELPAPQEAEAAENVQGARPAAI